MKHYKALFFDFDDTLFDFKKSEKTALEAAFSRYGIPANDKMYRLYDAQNQAYWRGFEKGIYKNEGDSAIRFVKFCQAIGRNDIDGVEMCEHYIDVLCSTAFEIENSVALLQKLSKYYDIYIITNALARVNDARSKIGGILPFVKDRFISERIGISKPQKGFFDYCFAHIPYTKEETLLIGDSLISDIRGGIDYGMDTCWFNRFGKENTEQMPITYEITALSQLEEILLKGGNKMKLVFLDAMTLTDAGADLAPFRAFGDLEEYPVVAPEQIVPLIADADVVFCNKAKLTAEKLACAKKLKYIGELATGYDNIDIAYCHAHGITVSNAGVYSTDNVAQQVFSFILNEYSKTAAFDTFVKQGGWVSAPTFSPLAYHTHIISEKTLGIFGFGNIGKAVANIALAFGMRVLVCTRTPREFEGVQFVDFDTLLQKSDILTIHCPLTEQTRNLFNKATFAKCKPSLYLINTSRGPVVNEADLYEALESGTIAGAALDVLGVEPMAADCKLLHAKNITFTPHIGWASDEAKQRLFQITLENFKNYLNGTPTNVV